MAANSSLLTHIHSSPHILTPSLPHPSHHTLTHSFLTPLQEWEDRDDDDIIVIERILLLLRNVLHITPDPQEEKVAACDDVSCDIM